MVAVVKTPSNGILSWVESNHVQFKWKVVHFDTDRSLMVVRFIACVPIYYAEVIQAMVRRVPFVIRYADEKIMRLVLY